MGIRISMKDGFVRMGWDKLGGAPSTALGTQQMIPKCCLRTERRSPGRQLWQWKAAVCPLQGKLFDGFIRFLFKMVTHSCICFGKCYSMEHTSCFCKISMILKKPPKLQACSWDKGDGIKRTKLSSSLRTAPGFSFPSFELFLVSFQLTWVVRSKGPLRNYLVPLSALKLNRGSKNHGGHCSGEKCYRVN